MKRLSLPLDPARLPRRSFAKAGVFALAFASLAQLQAQVGNNNASGVSGIFNGQIHTGCSYDPYTGNAVRSITDIAVAGAVGEYPLALVRTANSRTPSTTEVFGRAGGWNHNYNWILQDSPTSATANFQPTRYTVDFPDGRVGTFRAVTWDPGYYRVRSGNDTPASAASAGVRERFMPLSGGVCYLILPDGGKVKFQATQHQLQNNTWYYTYRATAIIDPYGLTTSLVYESTGPRRLLWVIEPAGRSLHFFYVTTNGPKISQVTASDGRNVNYYYVNSALHQVTYYNNPNWIALYQYCAPNIGDPDTVPPLLWTADDPMYPGPMKRIAYDYKPATPNNADNTMPVYGQILRERYWDGVQGHEASGAVVSTLTVGLPNNSPIYRTETAADGRTRTFVFTTGGYITWMSDFMGHQSTQGYDAYKYINSVIDFNRNETDYICDPITGNVTQIKYALTPEDTPGQGTTHPTVNYTYTNSYYLHTVQDEGGHTTTITRGANNRVAEIDYPDGGYETFPSYNSFGQVLTHRMVTGGTETFTYDARGLKQTYRNPSNPSPSPSPTARYQYDPYDRVSDITDVLGSSQGDTNHTTSFTYNLRGQMTVTTSPVFDGSRHSLVVNTYNPDGTLASRQDALGHVTSYTYDDYRRLTSVTTPVRDNNTYTTSFSYYVNGMGIDYRYTDSNVAWVHLPSGKWINIVYDDNRRKTSVTVGYGTADAATTSYAYDNVGNLTSVTNPLSHATTTAYDERNRPSSIYVGGHLTTIEYDTRGRKYRITRPNDQTITYTSYDAMNRLLTQTSTSAGTTQYTYYTPADGANAPVGLLKTFQDPHLYAGTYSYSYGYDSMGRKNRATYPPPVSGNPTNEYFTYDVAGRLATFQNRNGKVQTFTYDALNRMTGFTWNDNPRTSPVTFAYDAASRLTTINNDNATISRAYFNDNLLLTETETATGPGGVARTVTYTYDADGNRATLQIPGYSAFTYDYTGRNQLKDIKSGATTLATYGYDLDGNLTSRDLNNATNSVYTYDALDRVTWVLHYLNNTGRTFQYGYETDGNNQLWAKRLITPTSPEGNKGEVFDYDMNDQAIAVKLNVLNPDTTAAGNPTIIYDANGNRLWFTPYENDQYAVANNLNQYISRTTPNGTTYAAYDTKGNLTTGLDLSSYTYDAQNRLLTATKSGVTETFKYDGLNRQVSRTVGGITTYSVWDGWDLVQEYKTGPTVTASYLYGATGLVKNLLTNNYYYQDGSGSTSHLATSGGALLEWYRYDLQGTPFFYNASDQVIGGSNAGVRHLFTGQQWYSELGLYDLRNRFYSPDIGRFLQPDPIGFNGDATNLYRYCGNNPVVRSDANGTFQNTKADQTGTRGDGLDFGYFGGDGTGGVYFGLKGYDWTGNELGMLQTEQYYSMYNVSYTYAMGANGYTSIGGIVTSQSILRAKAVDSAPQGTVPTEFGTPDDAAIVVINSINPKSIAINREFAGLIVQNADGSYSYTGPYMGTVDTSLPGSAPPNAQAVADWHTHGAYDPNYESEVFSPQDMQGNTDLGYPGYLGTPSGAILKFLPPPQGTNPNNGTVIILQPPRH
jgi:RHS repeat-associated protein